MSKLYSKIIDDILFFTCTDEKIREIITNFISTHGIISFFNNIESFNVDPDTTKKLQALKVIITIYSEPQESSIPNSSGGDI